jgi:hypothetical protein
MLDLLQHLTIMVPVTSPHHQAGFVRLEGWRNTWRSEEAAAKARNLEQVKDAIVKQCALFANLLSSCSNLRGRDEMFGRKASMRLFLCLKTCSREELNTKSVGRE